MVLSRKKKQAFIGIIFALIMGMGLIPVWLPPYIYDFSHVNWNNADLAQNVSGDYSYFNNFPTFTTPSHLDVYDIRALAYDQQLVLTTLQGLVNKANTSLYLIYRDSDLFWLQRLREYFGVNYTIFTYGSYWDIIQKYNSSIKGVIIYDENFLDTVNVATLLAGLNHSVVIHSSMLSSFSTLLGLKPVWDFRGNFSSRVSLYSWAWDRFWPLANHKMMSSLDPTQTFFRDYIVAANIFTFWLEVGPFGNLEQVQLYRRFMEESPANIPIWGWFTDPGKALGEYEAVKAISHAGKYSFCAAIPDLTVLSAVGSPPLTQKSVSYNVSAYPLENKIYVTVVVSDGDNVNYDADYLLNSIWQNPLRGSVPLGFTLEPLMIRICPVVLRYYYESATLNDYFLAGPSGAGYCYVDMNPSFPSYLNTTKYALAQCDMHQVWLLNGYEGYQPYYSDEVIGAFTSSHLNLTGIYLDYHDFQAESNYLRNTVPVFHSMWVENENEIEGKLNSIAVTNPTCPIFVMVAFNSWDFSITKIKNVVDALPNNTFTFLRPDQFSGLFERYQVGLRTGNPMNESNVLFIIAIFFIIAIVGLTSIWFARKNEWSQNQESKGFCRLMQVFYVFLDVTILLTVKYCLYSTILNIIYLLLFLLSMTLGVFIKIYLERLVGLQETIRLSLGLAAVGIVLFAITPKVSLLLGIPVGILLSQQLQSSHLLFNSPTLGKKSFLYFFLLAATLILVIPFQYYNFLIYIIAIIFSTVSVVIIFLFKSSNLIYFSGFSSNIRFWYPKGVVAGILLNFLLNPTYGPERFFFQIFWGLENFPTKQTIAFAIGFTYLAVIILSELLRLKHVSISKFKSFILMIIGISCYIFCPLVIQSPFMFLLSNFLFIFGLLTFLDTFIISPLPFSESQKKIIALQLPNADPRGFTVQLLAWLILGLFLNFIPATIIVVDSQAAFALLGLSGIDQLSWSPTLWTLFYIPSMYMFLIGPITIFILIFGIVSTISRLL